MEQFKRYEWKDYEKMLEKYGYEDSQISAIKEIRESEEYEYCPFEIYRALTQQGLLKRYYKLKKPRCIYNRDGEFYFLDHRKKRYEKCAEFREE